MCPSFPGRPGDENQVCDRLGPCHDARRGVARARDRQGTRLSPALEQLRETVLDRLHTSADQLGLTAEQRDKIRDIRTSFAAKYRARRDALRELRQEELKDLGAILSPEQRDQVKGAVEEREESRQDR